MANRKEHLEFHQIDLQTGWRTPPGYRQRFSKRSLRARSTRSPRRELGRDCFASARAPARPSHLCMTIGRRFTFSRGTWSLAARRAGSRFRIIQQTPTPAGHPGSIMALSDPRRGACCLSSTTTSNRSDEELGQWLLSVRNNVSRRIGQSARVLRTVGGKISAPGAPFAPA
jgi:hypothetical protein